MERDPSGTWKCGHCTDRNLEYLVPNLSIRNSKNAGSVFTACAGVLLVTCDRATLFLWVNIWMSRLNLIKLSKTHTLVSSKMCFIVSFLSSEVVTTARKTVVLCAIRSTWKLGAPPWYSGLSSSLQNGDELCILWGTTWIYICYVEETRPPLWSSGQSSRLQNRDVMCFLWGTNWIYIYYVEGSRGSHIAAWRQDGLADWLSVLMWLRLRLH
jgi:hypothetical protein